MLFCWGWDIDIIFIYTLIRKLFYFNLNVILRWIGALALTMMLCTMYIYYVELTTDLNALFVLYNMCGQSCGE